MPDGKASQPRLEMLETVSGRKPLPRRSLETARKHFEVAVSTASCINAFKTGELSHFGRTYHIVRFILYRGGWGRFLQNPDTPANRTEGWGRPALIECRHSDEASLFLEILACIAGRSEERRVGKECRN